jgi:hypothetical protein
MQSIYKKSGIECIYKFAKFGLLHVRKNCIYCGFPMKVVRTFNKYPPLFLAWKCCFCFETTCITRGTPLVMMNLCSLHVNLLLYMGGAKPIISKRMCKQN